MILSCAKDIVACCRHWPNWTEAIRIVRANIKCNFNIGKRISKIVFISRTKAMNDTKLKTDFLYIFKMV